MIRDLDLTAAFLIGIAIAVPLFLLWAAVFIDLFRRKDLSVLKKALWAALAIFSVHVGVLLYFVFRPIQPPAGKRAHQEEERSSRIVSRLEQLHKEHDAGEITDAAYLGAKRELLGLGVPGVGFEPTHPVG